MIIGFFNYTLGISTAQTRNNKLKCGLVWEQMPLAGWHHQKLGSLVGAVAAACIAGPVVACVAPAAGLATVAEQVVLAGPAAVVLLDALADLAGSFACAVVALAVSADPVLA